MAEKGISLGNREKRGRDRELRKREETGERGENVD